MCVNGLLEMGMFLGSVSEQRMVSELGNHILYHWVDGQQIYGTSLAFVENGEGIGGFEGSKGSFCGDVVDLALVVVTCTKEVGGVRCWIFIHLLKFRKKEGGSYSASSNWAVERLKVLVM
jgi:hypothetical protein